MAKKTALEKEILKLIDQFTPIIRNAFFAALSDITDDVVLNNVIDAINTGDVNAAFEALGFNRAAMRPLEVAIEQAFETGGILTANYVPRFGGVKFRFDVRNSRAEAWLRDHSSSLVTSITDDVRGAIRDVLQIGLQGGRNPRNVALDIVGRIGQDGRRSGGLIGLTNQQANWVANARNELSDPLTASHWFTRIRRDKRFDSLVQRSIDKGMPLDADTINRLVSKYSDSLLQLRGETIARTEALQSLNQAQHLAFQQAIDQGAINQSNVKRYWDSSGDARVRASHSAMEGQEVSANEPFTTPDGYKLMFPGDSSLGAPGGEIINCRCVVRTRIDFLADALEPDDEPAPVVPPAPTVPPLPSPGGLMPRATDPIPVQQFVRRADPNGEFEIGSVPFETIEATHSLLNGYVSRYANSSLSHYVGTGYTNINGYLRVKAQGINSRGEPFKVNTELERQIVEIDQLMKPSELDFAGYRGVRQEFVKQIEGLDVGDQFSMDGFTSVSRASRVSLQFAGAGRSESGVLFKFIVPKGTPMITTNPDEAELILRSGHVFRIVKIETRNVPNPDTYSGSSPTVSIKVYSLEMVS